MIRIYRTLLRLYPESFRSSFGEEMLTTLSRVESERATVGRTRRVLSSGAEIAGLLTGIFVQRFRLRRSEAGLPAAAAVSGSGVHGPATDEIAEAEASVRFHLAQAVDCIAHHKFEGARFHAREEERARERLNALQRPSS